jgi:hypothetical protein
MRSGTEFIKWTSENHKGKAAGAGGIGLAIWIIWSQLSGIQSDIKQMQQSLFEIKTQVVVLDAIRQNQQLAARRRYE